jgi:hypothetical protein
MPFSLEIQFVKRAEEKLGRKLPLSYVAMMCRSNGGELSIGTDCWWLYPILDDSDRLRLKRTCNDIVRETASAQKWHGFPSAAVAIGHNGCGDQLVFLDRKDDQQFGDGVFWWDHETDELTKIADDFAELEAGNGGNHT